MYEFAGAGPCPFPGQLQYRVVNPRGAGVFFDKSFSSSIGPTLRPGSIVCGTPKTDPSGMSSYVVELSNGYANALDFEQLTSAAPAPVLASGDYAGEEWMGASGPQIVGDEFTGIQSGPAIVGAGACPYPGQLQYRVVNPRGAGVFFDKSFSSPIGPTLRPGSIVCGTPKTDPSGMSSYVVELSNGYANALDFEQLTSAAPAPVLASGDYDYVGDVSSINKSDPLPHLMPATGCPIGTYWDDFHGKCTPTIPLPQPPAPIPLTSGYYVGDGEIPPDLYGADAIQKGCMPGTYWDGWYQKCLPSARRPIGPSPLPPTLDDWRKQHVTGWDLFHDVFGSKDPFHNQRQENRWQVHHDERQLRHDEHHDPHAFVHDERELHHDHPLHEQHHEHWVGGDVAEIVGTAVSDGAVAADNAAVQADSAKLAASHPSAKGTTAAQSAQAAASHASHAASHAQAAALHPSPDGALAHAQKANQHAQQAAVHAANAHVASGNLSAVGAYYAGAAAGAQHQPPAAQAAAHAENATKQASSAKTAASHPSAQKNPVAQHAAHAASSHAALARGHAEAARSHPTAHGAEHHAREAMRHTNAAARHAIRAHGEARGRGREGFGGGRGFSGRRGGYRDAYGRFHGRRFHPEWRGYGHPGWRHGVGSRWLHHRAECVRHGGWACLEERIYEPSGNYCYRITPAGEMEGMQLGAAEQQANVVYVQATGQQPPTSDDGPMPGSDPSSDGSSAPADDAGDQSSADQDQGGDQGGIDQSADQGSDQGSAADQGSADQGADQDQSGSDQTADAGGESTDQTSGDFAGWQMQFTDPYGYFNMAAAPAWDSAYPYLPPDYWYPFSPPYYPW